MDGDLAAADYQRLLQFRTGLRRFLHWSAEQAERAGLPPAQPPLLLAVRGHDGKYPRLAPPGRRAKKDEQGTSRTARTAGTRKYRTECRHSVLDVFDVLVVLFRPCFWVPATGRTQKILA